MFAVGQMKVNWADTGRYGSNLHIVSGFGNLEKIKTKIKIIVNTEHTVI